MGLNKKIENILFSRAQEGEEGSFEILFNNYYSKLCTYASIIVKYPDVAEDIVQETFIKIWNHRASITINTTFKAYIYRSVHNNCINYLKNDKYRNKNNEIIRHEIMKQSELNLQNLDTEIVEKIVSEEFNKQFSRAVESLPQQCREVFLLCRNDKLTYSEVGERLDISINTVKTQMKRALLKLRDCLEKNLGK